MFEKILSPLDGTPAAEIGLAWAEQAAARCGASLELLSVVDNSQHEANGHMAGAEAYLGGHRDRIAASGLSVTAQVAVGAMEDEIKTRSAAAGLTVMTYPSSRWVFGSPLDILLREMVNPVVVVRGQAQPAAALECTRILVPIGDTAHSRGAVPTAVELCRTLGAQLLLCTVVSPTPGAWDKRNPPPEIAQAIEEGIAVAESMISAAGSDVVRLGIDVECIVRVGEPAREIIAAAKETQAGLIAMATRGSDSLSRMMSSVAMGVVQASPVPCLLVRPQPATN